MKSFETAAGTAIPRPNHTTPEYPTKAQIAAYGAFAFLYLRSDQHRDVPMHLARLAIQPAIDLGFFKIFEHEDVPRAAVTWAFLDRDAERRMVAGELLKPQDWVSGDVMWVREIIAPYGKGTAAAVVRWLQRSVPDRVSRVRYLRIDPGHQRRRIVEITRHGSGFGARAVPAAHILNDD